MPNIILQLICNVSLPRVRLNLLKMREQQAAAEVLQSNSSPGDLWTGHNRDTDFRLKSQHIEKIGVLYRIEPLLPP